MPELARYDFLPWMRRGIASEITEADTLGHAVAQPETLARQRAGLSAELKLQTRSVTSGVAGETRLSKKIEFIGPADINGISSSAILRTEPRDRVSNFETNCFPYIEFYEEDFPWRYTPAAVNAADARRLRPWIMLLVLEESEFVFRQNGEGLPLITLDSQAAQNVFFPHTQSWAWAHVHFYQDLRQTPGTPAFTQEVNEILSRNPDAAVSRVLCPRKLTAEKSYRAFLVPAFETGRLSGLGEDPSAVAAQAPSWQYGSASDPGRIRPFDFPVYYQWGFKTSLHGDFKSLAMLLQPQNLGSQFGQRPMDITQPGFGLDAVASHAETSALGFEGALKPPSFQPNPWPAGPQDQAYQNRLKQIVNLSTDLQDAGMNPGQRPAHPFYAGTALPDDPIVTPPIYAQHPAGASRAGLPGNPPWLNTLNLDPRHRATAGLGAKVVQEHQEEFMEAAWKQIGEVNAANQRIREAELAREVNQSLWGKRVQTLDEDHFLHLTGPMHTRLLDHEQTLEERLRQSRVPLAAKSPGWRKLLRPGQKMMRRLEAAARPGEAVHERWFAHFNLPEDQPKAVSAARMKAIPDMAVSALHVQADVDAAVQEFQQESSAAQHAFVDALVQARLGAWNAAALTQQLNAMPLTPGARTLTLELVNAVTVYQVAPPLITVTVSSAAFKKVYGPDDTGKFSQDVLVQRPLGQGEKARITAMTSLAEVMAYQQQFTVLAQTMQDQLQPGVPKPVIQDLPGLRQRAAAALHPDLTLTQRVSRSLKVWSEASQAYVPVQVLAPIMAHPQFFQATYDYLAKMSQDFIIPNCSQVPHNSLSLLTQNTSFIEAYFAGLNHEMGRELLWREYPTDLRGTYFNKFWKTRDNLASAQPDRDPDILPLHQWQSSLGRHNRRGDQLLVLVIRGELLQKYPNTVVYAHKAEAGQPGAPRRLKPGDDVTDAQVFRFPMITAQLEPDIALFGFALSVAEAKGGSGDPGWFFVLKERPGEVRFGLDDAPGAGPAAELQHLAWSHFSSDPGVDPACLDFDQARLTTDVQAAWSRLNAADWAVYTFRNPILFARHAREMLA